MMNFDTWQMFVLVAILLMISEIFVPGLILLPIGIGFLISAVFAGFITNSALLYLITALICAAVFLIFRKISHGKEDTPPATAVDAMIGKEVKILSKVTSTDPGNTKLYGDTWKALASSSDDVFEEGSTGVIDKVDGNKIYISKK